MEKDKIINRGTGAGGANTNKSGKSFEDLIDNGKVLKKKYNFDSKTIKKNCKNKYNNYLYKKYKNKKIVFLKQNAFNSYINKKFNIKLNKIPDEAYIIYETDKKTKIIILEKKNQNVAGSVDSKLFGGPSIKRFYEKTFGEEFKIEYIYCLSKYFKKKFKINYEFRILREILEENGIIILYGNDSNYFDKLNCLILENDYELELDNLEI